MKRIILAALGAGSIMLAGAVTPEDPVLMTIDGHDIRVSEFEYLYNKNNTQQAQPQSLDQYLGMFVDYKLKVAEAEHAGLNKTPEFQAEYNSFRRELAAPYMRDTSAEDSLVHEAYNMLSNMRKVSHIMVNITPGAEQFIDSLRNEIIAGNITFEEAAANHSIDRASSTRGGLMGYMQVERLPYPFVAQAYRTNVGEISEPVNSGFGWHIIRVEDSKPSPGEVEVEHILLITRGKSPAEVESIHARIDSIHTLLVNGADFGELAMQYSEDPGTRTRGGKLNWFGPGAMVAEFDSVSFALPVGGLSEPFTTAFGYHIVHKTGARPMATEQEMRPHILEMMAQDERNSRPGEVVIEREMGRLHAKLNTKNLQKIRSKIAKNAGGYDSVMQARLRNDRTVVATYDNGEPVRLNEIMGTVPVTASTNPDDAYSLISGAAYAELRSRVADAYRDNLVNTNADYRNLLNEYRDGILLYEISNREVWEKAAQDKEGLNEFFRANIDRYRWSAPKFKSTIIFASSDSILAEALNYAETLDNSDPAAFNAAMRERFGRDVKVERVIASRGENAITDYLAFGGEKPTLDASTRWSAYAPFHGRVLDQPEDAADVRGAAVTDYQADLERRWLERLHSKYRVNIRQDVLDSLRNRQNAR